MKNTIINLGVVRKIARALGTLNEKVIYVGGAVVSLYINDIAADEIRPTVDIDIALQILSLTELESLREELSKKGFKQNSKDTVMCRFRYDDIMVDVMSTTEVGWAPSDRWFGPGFKNSIKIDVEGQDIRILPLSYFLATKFSAYHSRGTDPRTSHDFEDIIYILDNRTDLVEQIAQAADDVKSYLENEFTGMLNNPVMMEAVSANLFYETRKERLEILKKKLKTIVK
jgi:predicted nucleotidyltransferase